MSTVHHRTWQTHHVAQVHITLELEPLSEARCFERHRGLADVTQRLVEAFGAARVAATWAVNDPAHSAATPLLLRAPVTHELAILGDTNWLGPMAGRTRFARELARRVSQARSAGLTVRTLVPRVAPVKRHVDLVVKQQLAAVAGLTPAGRTSLPGSVPAALHYGVWEMPVTDWLPRRALWFFQAGRSVLARIRRAARDAAMFHLMIDVPAVVHEGSAAEKSICWLLRRVSEFRDRGLIRIETLGAAATRLADLPAVTPQRSILHRAA